MEFETMFRIIAFILIAFSLVGCNAQQADEQVRAVLRSSCPLADQWYSYYEAVAASGAISQRTMNRVEEAKADIDSLCDGREAATVGSVLAAASLIYARTQTALKEARANGAAVGYAGELNHLDGMMAKLKTQLDRAR